MWRWVNTEKQQRYYSLQWDTHVLANWPTTPALPGQENCLATIGIAYAKVFTELFTALMILTLSWLW